MKKKLAGIDGTQAVQLVGIVAAMVVAVLVNVLAARHYKRWDFTKSKRFTLSSATVSTLRELPGTVRVWLLAGTADPQGQSLKQLFVAYQAETSQLDVRYVDPDRDRLTFEDIKRRFRIEAGRTEDNRVVADAVAVVEFGDKHWFISQSDLVEVTDAEDARVKPREEQAVTRAIRNVLRGERAKICFTAGHGEPALADAGEHGLGHLKDLLEKENYEPVSIDTTTPDAIEPFKGCRVVVIAGPQGPFLPEESERIRTYVMSGGNLLAGVSPINAANDKGMTPPGIADALSPFNIGLDEALVLEADPAAVLPRSQGLGFLVTAKPHAVTGALAKSDDTGDVPRVVLQFVRPLVKRAEGGATAVELLSTSAKAFGLSNIRGAKDWDEPPKGGDLVGPFAVAIASERPKLAPSAPHGPRAVVIGSASVFIRHNWEERALAARGAAVLVENALSWLAAQPEMVDIPERAQVSAGMRITEESRAEIRRYVLLLMPSAAALFGVLVALRRRSTEGNPRREAKP